MFRGSSGRPVRGKKAVQDFWNRNPCGRKFSEQEIGTVEFFKAVEQHRYSLEPHILDVADFSGQVDEVVLEIGCGLGTDGACFAAAGCRYVGTDLTRRGVELAQQNFKWRGLDGVFANADAERLPVRDDSVDFIYSHGVLHHTPDTAKAVQELHRALKPGGRVVVMIYNRNSWNYWGGIMFLRRLPPPASPLHIGAAAGPTAYARANRSPRAIQGNA